MPVVPPIQGLVDTPYMTSREALERRSLPGRMIVLGAGLVLLGHANRTGLARALAFGGGIALIWHFAFDFSGQAPLLQSTVKDVGVAD